MSKEGLMERKWSWKTLWRKEEDHQEQEEIKAGIIRKRERRKTRYRNMVTRLQGELKGKKLEWGEQEVASLVEELRKPLAETGTLAFPLRWAVNQVYRALSMLEYGANQEWVTDWKKSLEWECAAMTNWEALIVKT
jgi:hypothetical protein